MAEIVMTYRELTAWILVLALAGGIVALLIIKPPSWSQEVVTAVQEETTGQSSAPTPAPEQSTTGEKSCSDGAKNQDESDVDCGGGCATCANGKQCGANGDCSSGLCEAGVCKAKQQLSGKVTLAIKDVDHTRGDGTTSKVTGIELTLTNGLDKNIDTELQIWVKTTNGVYYLSQVEPDDRNQERSYATIDLPLLAGGKSLTQKFTVDGSYLWSINNQYDQDDDFKLEMFLIDQGTGDTMQTIEYTVRV